MRIPARGLAPRLRFPTGERCKLVVPPEELPPSSEVLPVIRNTIDRAGKVSYGLLALLLGLPLPIVIIAFLMGGCR
jgi:hypothetical protein